MHGGNVNRYLLLTAAIVAGAAPLSAFAQAVAPSLAAPIIAVPRQSALTPSLPANTEVWLSPNAEVNTKRIKLGEKFDMSVTRDVMLGDYIIIPRGTRGTGQVSLRTGKGAFGKSGKMEIDIVGVDLNGRQIPLTGHYRVEGQGNTGATVGAAVAVGVFSVFVTGRSASIAAGTEYRAFTSSSLPVALSTTPAQLAPAGAPATLAPAALPLPAPATAPIASEPAKSAAVPLPH